MTEPFRSGKQKPDTHASIKLYSVAVKAVLIFAHISIAQRTVKMGLARVVSRGLRPTYYFTLNKYGCKWLDRIFCQRRHGSTKRIFRRYSRNPPGRLFVALEHDGQLTSAITAMAPAFSPSWQRLGRSRASPAGREWHGLDWLAGFAAVKVARIGIQIDDRGRSENGSFSGG